MAEAPVSLYYSFQISCLKFNASGVNDTEEN
jgi:hypothetical protein